MLFEKPRVYPGLSLAEERGGALYDRAQGQDLLSLASKFLMRGFYRN